MEFSKQKNNITYNNIRKMYYCRFCKEEEGEYDDRDVRCRGCRMLICKTCVIKLDICEKYYAETDFQAWERFKRTISNDSGCNWSVCCPNCCEFEKESIYKSLQKHDREHKIICTKTLINTLFCRLNVRLPHEEYSDWLNRIVVDLDMNYDHEEQAIIRKAMKALINKSLINELKIA